MNPNPNSSTANFGGVFEYEFEPLMEFQLSDHHMLDDYIYSTVGNFNQQENSKSGQSVGRSSEKCLVGGSSLSSKSGATSTRSNINIIKGNNINGWENNKMEVGHRVAFRTKSKLEVMDDGFKWRKYGKKSVKNSPNPRNYYKCSSGGCKVKKRVERDGNDSSYVITTYEGVHNHECPGVVYYDHMSTNVMVPNLLTLQDSSLFSS